MRIYPSNLNWRGPLTSIKGKIEKIICHHPASTGTMEANHNYHRNALGWNGLGYSYWIDYDGATYEVRGRNVGAHSGANWNDRSYGPCFRGNFENQKMTDEQLASGIGLLAKLCREEGLTEKDIVGHRDVSTAGTLCPGKNFRMKELREGVAKLLGSGGDVYTVVKGDTMVGIASTYGVTLQEIIKANPQIKDPNKIFPGQEINIPERNVTVDDRDKIIEQLKADILNISMNSSQTEKRKIDLETGMKQMVSIGNNLVK